MRHDGEELLSAATLADLAAGADRLQRARCNVVVLGAFKRGKSTLLNALLETDVLPAGVLPLTSAATVVREGEGEGLLVHFDDDRTEEHPLCALREFATEPGNAGNARGVTQVEVTLAHPLLTDGLQLVDTPGIASVHRHNTRAAYDVLGRVDAALCVMSADQPLADAELELFEAAAGRAGRMLWVLTKVDQLTAEECAQAVAFVAGVLCDRGLADEPPDILPVSAVDGTGLDELHCLLRDLALAARDEVVPQAVARSAQRAAIDLVRSCELEERALELPAADLRARAATLEQRLAELQAAWADATDLMQRRTARLLEDRVNAPLLAYAASNDPQLQAQLAAHAADLAAQPPRALAVALAAWIDETVRTTFSDVAGELTDTTAAGLTDIAAIHTRRINQLLADVQQAAADALGLASRGTLPEVVVSEPAVITFKLSDPQHALDAIVATARRSLPGAFGRRLVLSDARERLRAMTDRHAGRLRAELVARAQEAMTGHQRLLDVAVNDAMATIKSSIAHAHHERTRGEKAVQHRLRDLHARRDRASDIALRVADIPRS
ncbi:MAG: dynamin family protein [Solirubrobacteraceae bacterium]